MCLITKELAAPASNSLASVIENLVGEILITLALTYPEAVMLLAVRLVKLPMGLVTEVAALIVLALTNPEADMLLAVRLVKLPMGLVIEFGENIPLALITPLELIVPVTIKPFSILNSLAIFYIFKYLEICMVIKYT